MSSFNDRQRILVFAGPEGAGKSTVTAGFLACGFSIAGVYINTDEIKHHRGCSDIEALREEELIRANLLKQRHDFTFETTLAAESILDFLEIAKGLGYSIESIFVLTASAGLCSKRIRARVLSGGYDAARDKNNVKYNKSLQLLKRLAILSDACLVVDNTAIPEVVYKKEHSGEVFLGNDFFSEADVRSLVTSNH